MVVRARVQAYLSMTPGACYWAPLRMILAPHSSEPSGRRSALWGSCAKGCIGTAGHGLYQYAGAVLPLVPEACAVCEQLARLCCAVLCGCCLGHVTGQADMMPDMAGQVTCRWWLLFAAILASHQWLACPGRSFQFCATLAVEAKSAILSSWCTQWAVSFKASKARQVLGGCVAICQLGSQCALDVLCPKVLLAAKHWWLMPGSTRWRCTS